MIPSARVSPQDAPVYPPGRLNVTSDAARHRARAFIRHAEARREGKVRAPVAPAPTQPRAAGVAAYSEAPAFLPSVFVRRASMRCV